MSHIMFEYLVCVVAVLGFATLVFLISCMVVLADEAVAYVFRGKRGAPGPTSHVGVQSSVAAMELPKGSR